METSAFDFALPDDLIAQEPIEPRDASRLLVVRRANATVEHARFTDLPGLLDRGDVLVRNNTRVVAARLVGRREKTGGNWEGLFLRELRPGDRGPCWEVLATTRGKPEAGETVVVGAPEELRLTLVEKGEDGRWVVRPASEAPAAELLERFGKVPLPAVHPEGAGGAGRPLEVPDALRAGAGRRGRADGRLALYRGYVPGARITRCRV